MPTPRRQHTPHSTADSSENSPVADADESQEISVPLNAGFVLRHGPTRPYGWLTNDAGVKVPLRISRVSPRIIEIVPEVIGLEEFDGVVCFLLVEGGQFALRGVFRFRSNGLGMFRVTHLDRFATQQLFALIVRRGEETSSSELPPAGEFIRDDERIRSIVWGLVGSGVPARVRASHRDWQLRANEIRGETIVWDLVDRGGAPTSPFVVEASGYSAGYELQVLLVSEFTGGIVTTLPRAIQKLRRRRFPRALGGEFSIRFRHPDFEFVLERPILDLSDGGIGFSGSPLEDLLYPGLWIPNCSILRNGQELVQLGVEIRSVVNERSHIGGVVHASQPNLQRWHDIVRAALHDRTRTQGFDPLALWDLYESSGYFSLSGKTPEDFAELKLRFQAAARRLRTFPELGYHVVWPSERGLDAAVTNMLVYSRAHVGYQMAKRAGRALSGVAGKEMLRDIHWHLLEEALAYGNSDWWIGYVQTSTRFSTLLCIGFQEAHRDPALECVVPVQVYEFSTTGGFADPAYEPATQQDAQRLVEYIQRTRPAPYWKSQDFTLEELFVPTIRAAWARAEFERDRLVLVARNAEGDVDAAMIMDLGHPGLHVYGLFDLARFYSLGPTAEQHLPGMLESARALYAERGRKTFKFFYESRKPLPDKIIADRCTPMGGASLCVMSMQLIPALLDYLFEQMTWDPADSLPPVARRTKPPSAFPGSPSQSPSASQPPPALVLPPNPKTGFNIG